MFRKISVESKYNHIKEKIATRSQVGIKVGHDCEAGPKGFRHRTRCTIFADDSSQQENHCEDGRRLGQTLEGFAVMARWPPKHKVTAILKDRSVLMLNTMQVCWSSISDTAYKFR